MTQDTKRPMNPRDRDPSRESEMDDARQHEKAAPNGKPQPSTPEQNRKLGKRHDD
jgi:hypothetical protein